VECRLCNRRVDFGVGRGNFVRRLSHDARPSPCVLALGQW
jgi:hypothetical protein